MHYLLRLAGCPVQLGATPFGDGHLESDDKNEKDLNYELLNNKNVLVVDDNQFNREVLDVILSQCKINVTSASSGHEAIEILKNNSNFDVILMDINMPIINGFDTTKLIRKKGITTPIIALTAFDKQEITEQALSSGMNDIIIKPFEQAKLFQVINSLVIKKNVD